MSTSNQSGTGLPFAAPPPFHEDGDTGSFHLGHFEAMYESLFAESLEGGEITAEERERLNLAAAALGLDAERVARLETALVAALEARLDSTVVEADPGTLADRAPPSEGAPPLSDQKITVRPGRPGAAAKEPAFDDEGPTLARPGGTPAPGPPGDAALDATYPDSLTQPRVSGLPDLDDDGALHARFARMGESGNVDAQFCTAAVLVRRGRASPEEHELYERHKVTSPARPSRPLTAEAWATHLSHPDEDRMTGSIFGVIASAALIGRVSAMRRDGTLPRLDAGREQDPATSTVSIVRALAWAAATLGMRTPPIYVYPEHDSGLEIVTTAPPVSRVGSRVLTGQSALRLAFFSGRHLSWYREEHFVCTLVPSIANLEDLFLATLLLGAPELALPADVRARAGIIAGAMRPCLEGAQLARLRALVAGCLQRGGIANLKRWARAAEWTACRTGLLLCGDLATACEALKTERRGAERVRELEFFWASDSATELRSQLGIAVA